MRKNKVLWNTVFNVFCDYLENHSSYHKHKLVNGYIDKKKYQHHVTAFVKKMSTITYSAIGDYSTIKMFNQQISNY